MHRGGTRAHCALTTVEMMLPLTLLASGDVLERGLRAQVLYLTHSAHLGGALGGQVSLTGLDL